LSPDFDSVLPTPVTTFVSSGKGQFGGGGHLLDGFRKVWNAWPGRILLGFPIPWEDWKSSAAKP